MKKQRLLGILVVMMLLMWMTAKPMVITAFAETAISQVRFEVTDNGVGNEPTVELKTDSCEIIEQSNWEYLSTYDDQYQRLRITVRLKPKDGYIFTGNRITLSGSGKNNANPVPELKDGILTVRISYSQRRYFQPENAYWDNDTPGTARVARVSGAKRYEFVLYVDGDEISRHKTTSTSYDFSSKLRKNALYGSEDAWFSVCAIDNNGNHGEYISSDEFYQWERLGVNKEPKPTPTPIPSKPNSCYTSIGRPDTPGSWLAYNGRWYFLNPAGQYMEGWIVYMGEWYYLEPRLRYAVEGTWYRYNGKYYYFYGRNVPGHKEGEMARNAHIGEYYVNNDGIWVQ